MRSMNGPTPTVERFPLAWGDRHHWCTACGYPTALQVTFVVVVDGHPAAVDTRTVCEHCHTELV